MLILKLNMTTQFDITPKLGINVYKLTEFVKHSKINHYKQFLYPNSDIITSDYTVSTVEISENNIRIITESGTNVIITYPILASLYTIQGNTLLGYIFNSKLEYDEAHQEYDEDSESETDE